MIAPAGADVGCGPKPNCKFPVVFSLLSMAAHVVEVLISSRPYQLPFAAVKDGSLTDATSILKRAYLAQAAPLR